MSATVQTLSIATADDHPVRADLYGPTDGDALVILCHGFKGHRRWGFFPYLGERLQAAGLPSLSMDFSYNGTVRDDDAPGEQYVSPELFEKNTLRRELDDLKSVVAFVRNGGLAESATPTRIGLMGHSRGAVSATLLAVEDAGIDALVSWSSTDDPDFYTDRQKEIWRRDNRFGFTESSENARLAMGIDYLVDLEENHGFYLLRERVRELETPHLLVHGEVDLVIPPQGSCAIYEAETQTRAKKLVALKTGHTFGVAYPPPEKLDVIPSALAEAASETVDWFVTHLAKKDDA